MLVATMAKPRRFCTILLRLLALGATVSATIVMATNHETSQVFNLSFDAKFSHTPAFKYFVIANAVGSLYSLLAVFLCPESSLWRLVVALDVVCTMLLTSSLSAALAIAEVGKKGNSHAGWLPICGQVPKFCDHAKGSLIAAFIGVVVYMILLLYYIHTGAV